MAPTLEDLLAIPPDQVTPQHVHMLGLAPDPIVPPPAPAAPPIKPMIPPASATESAVKPMTPPASPLTVHYHEAPEAKPKEPKAEKPEENPTGFRTGTAARWEPISSRPNVPSNSSPTAAPVAPNVGSPSFQPPIAPAPNVLPPLTPPNVPEALRQTTASALPSTVMPSAPAPTGIDTSLLNAPKRSLEGFQSREAEPRNLSLKTTAGDPAILDRPGSSGEH